MASKPILDNAQDWIIDVAGTIIFILGAYNIVAMLVGLPSFVSTIWAVIFLAVGLILMGFGKYAI